MQAKKRAAGPKNISSASLYISLYFQYAQQKNHEHWAGLQEWINLVLPTKLTPSVQLHSDITHTPGSSALIPKLE